jgi:cytochrome c oxidase subunit II
MLAAADVMQNALQPAAREAGHIANLWWLFFWVLTTVFVAVAVALFIALSKRSRHDAGDAQLDIIADSPSQTNSRTTAVVTSCVIITVLILFTLLVIDFLAGNKIYAKPDPNALAIRVRGHQWWWEVEYSNPTPSEIMTTANEIHVPVGRPVKLELESTDVIHSFWVPNMHGKKDLVPGHPATTWFMANREGEFRGQCAEYCGEQHAHMRMIFVAQKESDFEQWLAASKKSAPEPTTEVQRRGRELFISRQCVMCHALEGTDARAVLGPDLTHVASRSLIAAGEIPNTHDNMVRWIRNPQKIKPGTQMPPSDFSDDDLNALAAYMESLK